MNSEPLTFEHLEVVRAPGFEQGGFSVDSLCDGINIIHGPNASGKTTLARALTAALWPDAVPELWSTDSPIHTTIIGCFKLAGESWRVDLQSSRASYQRDGQDVRAPALPSADQRDRYRLSLHNLLQKKTRNESFADAIRRESAGGYDVSAAADTLGFRDRASGSNLGASDSAETALTAWREAQQGVQDLRGEERRLASLERDLDQVRLAQHQLDLVGLAINHGEAREALQKAEAALSELPAVLEDVSGDELDTLDEIESDIDEWETKQTNAEEKHSNAQDELDEADLPGGLPDELIAELKARRDRARELEGTLDNLSQQIAEAKKRRDGEREAIDDQVPEGKLKELDPVAWGELSEFATEAQEIHADRQALTSLERTLTPEEEPEGDLEDLRRGQQALADWLATQPGANEATGLDGTWAALTALVIAGAAAALGWFAPRTVFLGGLTAVAILAAAVVWYLYSPDVARAANGTAPREPYRRRVEELDLEAPSEWTPQEVRKHLDALHRRIAEHQVVLVRRQTLDAQAGRYESLGDREKALADQREKLVERFGVAPGTGSVQLAQLANHVSRWQDAHGTVEAKEASRAKTEQQLEEILEALNENISTYGAEQVEDAAEATRAIRGLDDRGRKHRQAIRDLDNAQAVLDEAEEKLDVFRAKREVVFIDLDLDVGDRRGLADLCDQRPTYAERRGERDAAQRVVKNMEPKIEDLRASAPELLEMSLVELSDRKRALEEEVATHDELLEEIKEIQAKINQARDRHDVEEAMAAKERALDHLEEHLASDKARMVGHVLATTVREESTEATRPEVFERAREILATLTQGRYRLKLQEGDSASFRAYDTVKERGFSLNELSGATRLHVLLSVRMAFVEQQEGNVQLPLLLDETLANTDDLKAQAIIDAAIQFARNGRQVFYFTAQGDEVAKWQAALENVEDVRYHEVDLAGIQDLDDPVHIPDLADLRIHTPNPPSPKGQTHGAYADRLDVPPLNPRLGAGAAHLWYVVEDPGLLHHLLRIGVFRWGQLSNLLETSRSKLITDDPDTLSRLRQDGQALEAFITAWKRGRGKPVDRAVLQDTPAISPRFLDDVADLAEEVDGDAERMIDALSDKAVPGFWESKMEELEAYFEEHGYIDPVATLEPDEIRVRVMRELVREGVDRETAVQRADTFLARVTDRSPGPGPGDQR